MRLEDAMSFSQIGIMHPSIIGPRNLVIGIINLQTFSLLKPIAEVNMENIHKTKKSISVKAYIVQGTLTYILEIPFIVNNIYDYIIISAITVHCWT